MNRDIPKALGLWQRSVGSAQFMPGVHLNDQIMKVATTAA